MKRLIIVAIALLGAGALAIAQNGPAALRCEHQDGEVLIDTQHPRLSWISDRSQAAYQILVASSAGKLAKGKADIWDSGKVDSGESHLVAYSGPQMESMKDYFWAVRVWDRDGNASGFSEPARWTTGMFDESDWKARWIQAPWMVDEYPRWFTHAPMFNKEFTVKKGLVSAKAFICGLGWFEMHLNGQRVGDDYFAPGFTDYTKRPRLIDNPRIPLDPATSGYRTLYLCHDVTSMLRDGKNAIGVLLGNGYFHSDFFNDQRNENYGVPRLICQIVLTYKNGSREFVCSDTSWKAALSPISFHDLYKGEVYDANLEDESWDKAAARNGTTWKDAIGSTAPDGRLTANMGPSDKVMLELRPESFEKLENGTYKVRFDREISGWIKLTNVAGKQGDTLRVKYLPDYFVGKSEYLFKDDRPVSWNPRFTWYVFNEAVISGVRELEASQVVAQAVNSAVKLNSEFDCSNPLFVRINDIWRRSQMDNMHAGVASDCPHRERLPYTGDGQIAMETVLYNFSAEAFYNKWLADIRLSQHPETGYVPNGAPWEPMCGGGPAWGAAICIMPFEFFQQYGDYQVLRDNLDAMKAYVGYFSKWIRPDGTVLVQTTKPDGTPFYWYNLGDWSPAWQTPDDALVHTFYWWLCAHYTALSASAIGETRTANEYSRMADKIRSAFNKSFYDPHRKSYGDFGSNVYALYMGVPDERLKDVRKTLRNELEVKYHKHLNTGMVATKFLFEVLSRNGMGDLAYSIMNQRDFPSFGWWIEQGATVTWEQWDGQYSRNHPMFGGGLTWFYKILAGVDVLPDGPGFRHIQIRPVPVAALRDVRYSTETPYGKVVSKVSHDSYKVRMEVTVPHGCRATVFVPKSVPAAASNPLSDASYVRHEVGPGHWTF